LRKFVSSFSAQDELDLAAAKETVGEKHGAAAGDSTPAGRPAVAYPRYRYLQFTSK
jgi:hypothetical protein